ncbi:fungal-specific transcription factor domain-containing protein [Aspergillus spectabilis]
MSPPADTESGRKRRRIALACDECRERNRKCDGVKPVCGTCAKRPSSNCVWDEDRNTKGWSNSYVASLKDRIRELEQAAGPASSPLDGHRSPSRLSQGNRLNEADRDEGTPRVHLEQDGFSRSPDAALFEPASIDLGDPTDQFHDSPPRSRYANSAAEDSTIDAMGVFGAITGDHEHQKGTYFGPSSTLSFLNLAHRAASQHENTLHSGRRASVLQDFFQGEGISVGGSSSLWEAPAKTLFMKPADCRLTIPPRHQADELLDSYWTCVHSLYPFLHRPSFMQRYAALWTSNPDQSRGYYAHTDEKLFHCLLNLTFALGSQFNTTIKDNDRREIGVMFFQRVKALMDFDMFSQGNIFLVQALILMGQYLQSTDMSTACWNMAGMAIRVAQGIGLHHESRYCDSGCKGGCGRCSQGKPDPLETEMRRRAWTGCILLDRIFSMAYGRPLMIHPTISRHCVLPVAVDDECLPGFQPAGTPSLTECYVQSIKLQQILGEVLFEFYYGGADKIGGTWDIGLNFKATASAANQLKTGDLQTLLEIDNSLSAWHRSLPAHLKAQSYTSTDTWATPLASGPRTSMFNRQAVILHARFLHIRLIMFRPVLSALFNPSPSPLEPSESNPTHNTIEFEIRQSMLGKGVNICASAACELVNLISGNLQNGNDLLPPPWYNVFYIHSCSVVILISRLYCLDRIQNQAALVASWSKCLVFFGIYQKRSQSAARCLRIMEALQRKLFTDQTSLVAQPMSANNIQPNLDFSIQSTREWDPGRAIPFEEEDYIRQLLGRPVPVGLHQTEVNDWLGDPPDMNWLSVFPFVEGAGAEGIYGDNVGS